MWISLKFISAEKLHFPVTEEIKSRDVFIRNMSLVSLKANVQRIAGSFKPMVLLDGLFHIEEETLITLAQPEFVVHVTEDCIICSLAENVDDGVSRAIVSIQHYLNLN
ncbi:unnamed protein product [Caenorhabditis brenneri]